MRQRGEPKKIIMDKRIFSSVSQSLDFLSARTFSQYVLLCIVKHFCECMFSEMTLNSERVVIFVAFVLN